MGKGGAERAVAYLGTVGAGLTLAEKIATEHASGDMVLDPYSLASLYRKEVSAPTTAKDRYQNLASLLVSWIEKDFEAKLNHITKAGKLSSMMMTTHKQSFSRGNFRPVTIAEMRDKLPTVCEKVRRGDLTRFVHLISAAHCYGVCMSCGQHPTFSALMPRSHIEQMRLTFNVYPSGIPDVARLLDRLEYPHNWYPVIGLCGRTHCRSTCSNCTSSVPLDYDPDWIAALLEDGMCKGCAAKQLINVKRPKFTRREQRQLRRLIIT